VARAGEELLGVGGLKVAVTIGPGVCISASARRMRCCEESRICRGQGMSIPRGIGIVNCGDGSGAAAALANSAARACDFRAAGTSAGPPLMSTMTLPFSPFRRSRRSGTVGHVQTVADEDHGASTTAGSVRREPSRMSGPMASGSVTPLLVMAALDWSASTRVTSKRTGWKNPRSRRA